MLQTLNSIAKATTKDYGSTIEGSIRSVAFLIAAFIYGGELARQAWTVLKSWSSEPNEISLLNPAADVTSAPPKPPVAPPPPVKTITVSAEGAVEKTGTIKRKSKARKAVGFGSLETAASA